MSVTSGQ